VQDARVEAAQVRLRQSVGQEDALEAIREIVANLLGSEEMLVFGVDQTQGLWWILWSFGVELGDQGIFRILTPPVLQLLQEGKSFVGPTSEQDPADAATNITAFVPIRSNGITVAVLVIFRLLPQKNRVEAEDLVLFDVITREAGYALFQAGSEPEPISKGARDEQEHGQL
jgi:hypothetical protein